jgi:GTP cyclohydrolase II
MFVKQEFVETKLVTKFAEFFIRIYRDDNGKETIVLYTKNVDFTQAVLVRVHSECITGDMFGSLHCDCGKQLSKSLQVIAEEGGVLVYLRQEGRGIGLFEKIKSYKLQSEGYDTFEANVILGHQPDQRSYEMVKVILDDLNITRIRLLTNNPSKVSNIAKLGIDVIDQIPIISKANKHNKTYLETKRNKFQHFLKNPIHHYVYQFHADEPHHVTSIIEFMKYKKKDPLLKIGIGISADIFTINNENEIERIRSIVKTSDNHPDFIPIVHFSFMKSSDVLRDIHRVKETLPFIKRLQLNDFPSLKVDVLKEICEMFSFDIPLSDENFDLVYNSQFRDFVKRNKSCIMLDNSKGRGIKDSKDSFIKKVDVLLAYGLTNIALCGGFGPDQLDTYCAIKRYYRINFSIDAETNLKTNDVIDIEKVKIYLFQLMRFDDPKEEGIEQTRKFLKEHRRSDWDTAKVNGREFLIHPKVFHAGHFPSTSWFASEVCALVKGDSKFCEVGCGSGVISCSLAITYPKLEITATDINPFACENTKLNAEKYGLSSRINVVSGDVLDSINSESCFDSIFWALPFGFLDPGTDISLEEAQVFDPGYRAIRKFFQTAKNYLKLNGKLFLGFSSDLGHSDLLVTIAKENSIKLMKITEKIMKEGSKIKFEILEGRIILV